MLTAVQAFYNAIDRERLPGSIPVEHPDGTIGLLTGSAGTDPDYSPLVFDEDCMIRASMAIRVCMMTSEAAQSRTILKPITP